MTKKPDEPIPVTPAPPRGAAPPRASGPEARVIPEYRAASAEGGPVLPVRLADFAEEAKAGWRRYKVVCRVPYEATHPSLYVLAPNEVVAGECARAAHGLLNLPPAVADKLQTVARELPD